MIATVLGHLGAFLTWLAGVAPLLIAGSAVVGATVAVLGYRKWMPESVGKRKIELAEDVLALVYEAESIVQWARFPGGYGDEGSTRPRADEETRDERTIRDMWYIPVERLMAVDNARVFSDLLSKRYRAMAYFGRDIEQPFKDLKLARSRIIAAASLLVRHYTEDRHHDYEKYMKIVGWDLGPDDQDEFGANVSSIVARFEAEFGEWVMQKKQ